MEPEAQAGRQETLAEMAARIKGQVLAGISGDVSPEQIHRLAGMIRELHRVEALMDAERSSRHPGRTAGRRRGRGGC